ncbi:MAG: PEP-CTERM sorting domain-containing protein [Coleofasciculus sp. C2-GNP5-27]
MNKFAVATLGICLGFWVIKSQPAFAAIFPIGINDFSGNETLVRYEEHVFEVPLTEPVHGQTFRDVLHQFTVNGQPSLDADLSSGTGHLVNGLGTPMISGPASGVLSLIFPNPQNRLGYGFATPALGTTVVVPNATTVELFDVNNFSLGTISEDASGYQNLYSIPGGFLGVESTTPFLRAEVSFKEIYNGSRFSFDNLRYESVSQAVPEPATLLGLVSVLGCGVLLKQDYSRKQKKS